MAGAEPRQGNSRGYCEADRKIDARPQAGTALDENTDMREPANKRMLTDVSGLRSHRCTISRIDIPPILWRGRVVARPSLTRDIRRG